MNDSLVQQLMRFGVIGIIATLIHAAIFHLLHAEFSLPSIPANLISFTIAFAFSYIGHLKWTFAPNQVQRTTGETGKTKAASRKTLPRFFTTALFGLSINLLAGWLIIEHAQLSHYYFLGIVIFFTPAMTFVLSKYWAFKA